MAADWSCSASRDLPLDQSSSWDGPAAEASIFAWAGWPDNPDSGKAAKGFLAFDRSAPKLKGSYKLPFARVVDGKLTCVASGVRAAASRLSGTDIPDSVKTSARAVINAYEKKWQDDGDAEGEHAKPKKPFPGAAPEFGQDDDASDGEDHPAPKKKSTIPAKPKPRPYDDITADASDQDVPDDDLAGITGDSSRGQLLVMATRVPIIATRGLGMTPEEQEKAAFDPDIFASNQPYVFRAQISNDQLDAYHTRMHPSSLRNYADDAQNGVALMNSHRSDELPMGHTFRGRYVAPSVQGDQIAKTHADMYVVPGLQLNEVHNDHLINGIRSGTVRDVSVGFYGGRYRCILCNEFWSHDDSGCQHVPGLWYRVKRANGDEEEMPASAWVHGARLAEVSTVYDGATPNATIIKAKRMADAGRLSPAQARYLESQYRIRLYGSSRYFALAQEKRMNGPWPRTPDASAGMPVHTQADQGLPGTDAAGEQLRSLLDQAGVEPTDDPWQGLRSLLGDYTRLKGGRAPERPAPAGGPSEEERRLIEEGRSYRAMLTERALAEGVRAFGTEFDREYQERRLRSLSPVEIEKEARAWSRLGDRLYPGGRQGWTDQEIEKGVPRRPAATTPDDAYRG